PRPAGTSAGRAAGVGGPGALVALGPRQQLVDGERRAVDAGVEVAEGGDTGRHGADGAVARLDVVDLVPGDRGRHRGLGHAPHRVGRGHRVVAGVLVVVDEDGGGVP